ncbi:killer cell lectin-like receptor subfamily G member 2 [Trichechus inunguis]
MEPAGPEFLMEPLGSRAPGPEPGPAEEAPRPESPPRSPGPAGGDRVPPALPRSLGMGQGAFRHPGSPEPQNPAAESPCDRETPGPEPGARAPTELKVDVRATPVGAAGGRTPSPAPSTRFLTVPVPESPVCARRAALPLLSPGATWSPLAVPWAGEGAGSADGTPASPPGCCRCRELGLDGKEGAALLSHAEGTRLPRAVELIGLPVYMRSLRWALAIMAFFLAVSTVTMVALASRAGARCRQCPQGWMWAEEQCFYLSTKAQAWEASQAFCSAHHATLPLLSHTQGFLSKHHVAPRSWVGALRGPQGWYWTDGTPLPPQLLPKEDKDHPELSCGGLEEGRLVALDCTVPRPWVCARAPQ